MEESDVAGMIKYIGIPASKPEMLENAKRIRQVMDEKGIDGRLAGVSAYDACVCVIEEEDGILMKYLIFDGGRWARSGRLHGYGSPNPWDGAPAIVKIEVLDEPAGQLELF